MLEGSFFTIQAFGEEPSGAGQRHIRAEVLLDPGHPIYGGHFPGQPVVPGVCQIRMVQEITQRATGLVLRLQGSDTIKFLRLIDPRVDPRLDINLMIGQPDEGGRIPVVATLGSATTMFLKFKGKFTQQV